MLPLTLWRVAGFYQGLPPLAAPWQETDEAVRLRDEPDLPFEDPTADLSLTDSIAGAGRGDAPIKTELLTDEDVMITEDSTPRRVLPRRAKSRKRDI